MSDPNLPEGVKQRDIDRIGEPNPLTWEGEYVCDKDVIYGMDGNQHTCHRSDFDCLATSLCGFGDTQEEALGDLIRQEEEQKEKP